MRQAQRLTQAQLAEKAGLSENFLGSIERGTRTPSIRVLENISNALKVKMKDLFEFPDEGIYPSPYEETVTKLYGFIRERSAEDVELIWDVAKRILKGRDRNKEK